MRIRKMSQKKRPTHLHNRKKKPENLIPYDLAENLTNHKQVVASLVLVIDDQDCLEIHISGKKASEQAWSFVYKLSETLNDEYWDFLEKIDTQQTYKEPDPHKWYGFSDRVKKKHVHLFREGKSYCGLLTWDPLRVKPKRIFPVDLENQPTEHTFQDPVWFCTYCKKGYQKWMKRNLNLIQSLRE